LNFEKTGNLGALDPRAMGFEQLYNLTNEQTVNKQSDLRDITSTSSQKKIQDLTNQTIAKNAEGVTLEKAIGTLNGEIEATSGTLSQLKDTTNQLTNAFNGLMSKLGGAIGGEHRLAPAKVPAAKPMSGSTGTGYNATSGHAISPNQQREAAAMTAYNKSYFGLNK
jgi:phage-related protein